jgi:hypothetical protein
VEPRAEAVKHLQAASSGGPDAAVQLGMAAVFAILHVADTVQHGLRDILYELRS